VPLLLLGLSLAGAAGMFDLIEGEWEEVSTSYSFFEMQVGNAESRSFTLVFGERSKDSRRTTLRGTYKVLANKGDPHFSWIITESSVSGRGPRQATLKGMKVSKGTKLSGILVHEKGGVTLNLFDAESQLFLTKFLMPK
jgi:hypothetical protein